MGPLLHLLLNNIAVKAKRSPKMFCKEFYYPIRRNCQDETRSRFLLSKSKP